MLLDAVLIPFRGSIISDGLVVPYRIYFGKGAREGFKEEYMNAKRNHTIRFSIYVNKPETSQSTKHWDVSYYMQRDLTLTHQLFTTMSSDEFKMGKKIPLLIMRRG